MHLKRLVLVTITPDRRASSSEVLLPEAREAHRAREPKNGHLKTQLSQAHRRILPLIERFMPVHGAHGKTQRQVDVLQFRERGPYQLIFGLRLCF